ncbi:MAG: hypothetical protein CMJ83_13235 [Planctomycetes bacterium]|nr:hypothetical protein [Planctomycetota bacterium]
MSRIDTDANKMLCYCLGVRYGAVVETIREHDYRTVSQVTRGCKAGGGCRSCHPEIEELIEEVRMERQGGEGVFATLGRLFRRK